LKRALTAAGIDVSGQRITVALFDLELQTVICSGPVRGRHHTYGLVDELLPSAPILATDQATALLVERYLAGHGPALLKDLRWWSTLTLKQLHNAVEDLGDRVQSAMVGGEEYLWLAEQALATAPAASERPGQRFRLLQVFDELFVGYSESRGLVDPDGEFGSVLPIGYTKMMHVVLEGDRLAGRWRTDKRRFESGVAGLEVTLALNRPVSAGDVRELEAAVEAYGAFVGVAARAVVREPSTR
jgi:uncharacterized protein YcaQ